MDNNYDIKLSLKSKYSDLFFAWNIPQYTVDLFAVCGLCLHVQVVWQNKCPSK